MCGQHCGHVCATHTTACSSTHQRPSGRTLPLINWSTGQPPAQQAQYLPPPRSPPTYLRLGVMPCAPPWSCGHMMAGSTSRCESCRDTGLLDLLSYAALADARLLARSHKLVWAGLGSNTNSMGWQ